MGVRLFKMQFSSIVLPSTQKQNFHAHRLATTPHYMHQEIAQKGNRFHTSPILVIRDIPLRHNPAEIVGITLIAL